MIIEGTEVKISFTIREAQALSAILARVNRRPIARRDVNLVGLPQGVFEDAERIEFELRRLLEVQL